MEDSTDIQAELAVRTMFDMGVRGIIIDEITAMKLTAQTLLGEPWDRKTAHAEAVAYYNSLKEAGQVEEYLLATCEGADELRS